VGSIGSGTRLATNRPPVFNAGKTFLKHGLHSLIVATCRQHVIKNPYGSRRGIDVLFIDVIVIDDLSYGGASITLMGWYIPAC
jgi:hypothetical protein